jgi:glycosyltransferase involved in cell wall biosynthesis
VRVFSQVPKAVARAVQESVDIGFIALKPSSVFRFGISPNKIFDYMMSSLPVVSAIDAANDIVTQAGCGRSVPHGGAAELAAAIRELAGLSLAERRALGHRGYEYVMTNHDYLLLSRRYLEVILPH